MIDYTPVTYHPDMDLKDVHRAVCLGTLDVPKEYLIDLINQAFARGYENGLRHGKDDD